MALLAFTAIVAAPLFEEMVFRGFLQPLLSRTVENGSLADWWLTASSYLAACIHPNINLPGSMSRPLSIVGVVLGVVASEDKFDPARNRHARLL